MKKRKKKWTTKNTHIKKGTSSKSDLEPKDLKLLIAAWIVIAAALLFIILVAFNNHIIGYDNFIGIPSEWVRSLLK